LPIPKQKTFEEKVIEKSITALIIILFLCFLVMMFSAANIPASSAPLTARELAIFTAAIAQTAGILFVMLRAKIVALEKLVTESQTKQPKA
jgi:hypothetical protein